MKYRLGDIIEFNPKEKLSKGKKYKKISMEMLQPYKKYIENYTEEEYKGGSKFRNGDTLLARITPCLENGKTAQVNELEENEIGFGSTEFIVMRAKIERSDKDFIYYLSINKEFRNIAIKSMTGTSGRQRAQVDVLKDTIMDLPEYNEQVKIAKILSSIDKKIQLNNKINNNLYELSSVLYKKWFGELNENNSVPFSQFDKLGKVVMGQSPKGESYNYNEDGVPLINGAADYEKSFLKAQKYTTMPTKICNRGDLIFCIRATIGLLTICDKKYCLGRGVAGITNIDEIYKEYSYHLIESSIESFKRLATGSVIVGITRDDIQNIKVKVPSLNQIDNFHEIQKPIFQKAECIKEEIRRLSQLRDILLPKLMNGEIDLDKIEI